MNTDLCNPNDWYFANFYAIEIYRLLRFFVIDHGKKYMTFIDFTLTQDWCKHIPYTRFTEAIIMTSKKKIV
jgi:hypothetical protein